MDKEYVLFTLRQRIAVLKDRYRLLCHGKTSQSYGGSAVSRSEAKRDLNLCLLVEELIVGTPGKLTVLSDEAQEGLEKLMEPLERHRRLKDDMGLESHSQK